jgi:predicted RND superfamily exporter protein
MTPPARALHHLALAAVARPRLTIALALLLALAGAALAVDRLELRTSNLDLVDPELPAVAAFRQLAAEFGTPNSLVVVLEGPDRAALRAAADDLAPRLRSVVGTKLVLARLPLNEVLAAYAGISRHFESRDGGMLFLFVQPADETSRAATIGPFVRGVRAALDVDGLRQRGIRAGLTGLPQYAVDDEEFVRRDVSRLSTASFVLVLALFLAAFAALRRPLLAMATLLVAVGIVLGLVTLWPGHLTLLSAFFASILFGLGTDYGIHLVDRVEGLAAAGIGERRAVAQTVAEIAPGLATGTLTTAAAFLSLTVSGFHGFVELGWIAAGGVLVCQLAAVSLLPALLVLLPPRRPKVRPRRRVAALLGRLQRPWIALALVAACVLAPLAGWPGFDGDYSSLQPRGSEAVRLEREMVARSGYSPQFAAFVTGSRAESERLATSLYRDPLVGQVRSIADLDLLGDAASTEVADLRAAFASPAGHFAVYAYPSEDVWNVAHQERFLAAMRAHDPRVTGMPFLGHFMVEQSWQALARSGAVAALLVILWAAVDFRRPGWAALALLPTGLMLLGLLGAMRLLGVAFNPIAVMGLPIVIGIGVDESVHLVHRYRSSGDLVDTLSSTGRAVVLTAATALASFGSLAFAEHRGLASFGLCVALGVGISLLLSVLVLPAALAWLGPGLRRRDALSAPAA